MGKRSLPVSAMARANKFARGTPQIRFCTALAALLSLVLVTVPAAAQQLRENPQSVAGGLVVSVDRFASRIGAETLQQGGNAVDAAIATGFALAVTHPEAGNIGGGGFMVVRLAPCCAKSREPHAQPAALEPGGESFTVDFREMAPAAAHPKMFLDEHGNIDPDKVGIGWVVVGVPGSVMGYWTAHEKAGRLPWRDLVAPAVQLAEEGFTVDDVLSDSLKDEEKTFARFPETARIYLRPDGTAPKPGERLVLPELAHTLHLIMEHGPDGFYQGETAHKVAQAMRKHGGLITEDDLLRYRAVIRKPVTGTYRGYDIVSIGPPSSGGTTLVEMLNILEGYDLGATGQNTPATLHLLAEAMKRGYYDRAKYLGDPDFVDMPLAMLLSKDHAKSWRESIGPRATPSETFGADILTAPESNQTTHFSVIDGHGNMVATTTTLEEGYGARVIAEGTGFLLNNEMHDFNVKPGATDRRGLVGTAPNLIAPGKRMLSSQDPTLVLKDGKPFLVLGSPGGRTIINTVLQVISNVIDHHLPVQAAVDAPRIHHQWMPDRIRLEPTFSDETVGALESLGHRVRRAKSPQGDCHAIYIDPATGRFQPGTDHRRRGAAFGW